MKRLAEDLEILNGFPPYGFNVYVMGGVLVDAADAASRGADLPPAPRPKPSGPRTDPRPSRPPGGQPRRLRGARAAPLVRRGRRPGDGDRGPDHGPDATALADPCRRPAVDGSPHPVARRLRQGDEVGGFRVIETPGHTIGHISFWREHDRVLVLGDVLANMNLWTGLPMLREPQRIFSHDPAMNRRSAARLAELEPRLVCFGHGPPLRNPAKLRRFVARFDRPG